ncbi:ParB N-terminal domain-containing protein [Microbacterium panaciterrae]|uniref:ParB-like N-terminal domain-containing protein n=1 Tax=Microbacterium panaciterrae TaxID=985759 RepID=A0ABP8PG56_9MICO
MSGRGGSIELDRAVDSIIVGARHRTDLGDLDDLAASIAQHGLLQPLTVTLDGILVCGARRLAAIKQLGWRTVGVWVRSGISDQLGHLLAEQDDDKLHKALTPVEAADLYQEIKTLMAEDAARRMGAGQFSDEYQPRWNGSGKFPEPLDTPTGESREQAASMIPGAPSYKTLDKIAYLRQIADDLGQPAELRAQATREVEQVNAGEPVHPAYARIREAVKQAHSDDAADLQALAAEAVVRAQRGSIKGTSAAGKSTVTLVPERWSVRAFVTTWSELESWWLHFDVTSLAAALTDEQVTAFLATVDGSSEFADALREAWDSKPGTVARGHLHAL